MKKEIKTSKNIGIAPKGLKQKLINVVKELEKYERNRYSWVKTFDEKSAEYKRKGIVTSNFKKAGASLCKAFVILDNEFGNVPVSIDNLPFHLSIHIILKNMEVHFVLAHSLAEYKKLFERILKKSKF